MDIIINTQEEFDKLKEVKKEDYVIVECEVRLNLILNVFGKILFKKRTDCTSCWGDRKVVARENSSVEARGNSSVEARENSVVRLFSNLSKIVLYGFSVLFQDINLKAKIEIKSKNVLIQKTKLLPYLKREGIEVSKGKVILYKKVSLDFKTQENTKNKTIWKIGETIEHKNFNPKEEECGEGKFHACSKPYFCDEFRNTLGDKYIAIEIEEKDLFEWKQNPQYPHKIAFKKGRVLFECNKFGKEIKV